MNELNQQLISMYAKQLRVPTFNRHQSELLFNVIADRSERKSIIVSTNLAFSVWLTYCSFVLNMNSDRPYRAEFAAQSDHPIRD